MKYKMVLFDFDGTIAQTYDILYPELIKIIREQGYTEESEEEIENTLKNLSMMEIMSRFDLNPFELLKYTKKLQSILKDKMDELQFYPGMTDAIQLLQERNIVIGIVSSNSVENIEEFLRVKGIDSFTYVEGGLTLFGKDNKIKKVLNHADIPADEALYVGDEVRDVDTGRDAGTDTLAVTWGINSENRLVAAGPTYLVNNENDLLKLLNEKT